MKNCMQLKKFTVWNISYILSSRCHTTMFTLAEVSHFKSHIHLSIADLGIIYLAENTSWMQLDVYRRLRNFDNEEETKLGVFEILCVKDNLTNWNT